MTKLPGADSLRSVQLFHELYGSTINDFAKINKMVESHLNTKEIAPEELKAKRLTNNPPPPHPNYSLKKECNVDIENSKVLR